MSLVDQIFEQAKLGTAPNPDANPFAGGLQLGLQQQHLNQQAQELAMEIAQAPLKQTLLQQDAAYKQAETEKLLYDRQTVVGTQQELAGLAGIVSQVFSEATPEDAAPYFFKAVQKNPRIAENPAFQRLWQDVQTSVNAKAQLKELELKGKDFTPQAVSVPSPVAGEPPFIAVRTGPNSYTLPQSSVMEVKTPEGTVIQQRTGAGGVPSGAGGAIEKSVVADAEKKLNANTTGLAMLNESLGKISPTTVGPVGAARELGEKVGAIVGIPMGTQATEARSTFRSTAQNLFNSLKADSQINKWEGARISEIADITKLDESDPTARKKYEILRDLTAYKSLLLNHELNRFAPDDVLRNLSLDQANRAFERGHLTKAEAQRWGQLTGH